ncbi:Kelch repeat-containing protein [Roseateles sp. DB2]|uniref:Kelch repeat-containing protein n=1 Tax=Roseateles sp. DB2 TaxID=3453717 RepID=UPI003EEC0764
MNVLILSLALSLLAPTASQAASAADQAATYVEGSAANAAAPLRLNIARSQGHTVTTLRDGRLLVLGGKSNNLATSAAELIDPRTGRVELLSSMVQARQGHTATLLPDGRVLVTGGDLGDGRVLALNSAELFDPKSKTFRTASMPMTLERAHHTATLLKNGKVLITGGQGVRPGMVSFSAELFDPVSGRFESLAPQRLVAPRTYHAATLLDSGQVLIAGGTDWQTLRAPHSAEVYDPVENTFTQLESPLSSRNEMPLNVKLSSGHVLVLNSQDADLFDPVTQTFKPLAGPLKARNYEAVSALYDGGAVVLGGISAGAVTPSVERYDPVRGTFRAVGKLRKERAWGVATLAYTGAVFVIGGVDSADAPIADVAVYWP